MSKRLSHMIADFLLHKKAIDAEEAEICQYGYEVLIYGIEQIIILLILGWLSGQIVPTCIYLLIFTSIRKYTGGYHANTRVGCTIVTILAWMVTITFIKVVSGMNIGMDKLIVLCLFYFFVMLYYAPVEHEKKPLFETQKKRNKQKTIILSLVYMVIALLAYLSLSVITYSVIFTMMNVAMLIIIEKFRKGDTKDEIN